MEHPYRRLRLKRNPFEPAATDIPADCPLWIPDRWREPLEGFIRRGQQMQGPKAFVIVGSYGSGKTYLLRWMERELFPREQIRPFYIKNPGSRFYDLADRLFSQLGREELAKAIWEWARPHISGFQPPWLESSFAGILDALYRQKKTEEAIRAIAARLLKNQITPDEEIAYQFGRLVIETTKKPYFSYRDFVAGTRGALVPERDEALYFSAVIRILQTIWGLEGVAFLIDEFEEVAMAIEDRRLTRREVMDYMATLRQLIDATANEPFWLALAMTPEAARITEDQKPDLWQRMTSQGDYILRIPPLTPEEAEEILRRRLDCAREDQAMKEIPDRLYPFPPGIGRILREDVRSSPRRLIQLASHAIAKAVNNPSIEVPFQPDFLQGLEEELFPRRSREEIK